MSTARERIEHLRNRSKQAHKETLDLVLNHRDNPPGTVTELYMLMSTMHLYHQGLFHDFLEFLLQGIEEDLR